MSRDQPGESINNERAIRILAAAGSALTAFCFWVIFALNHESYAVIAAVLLTIFALIFLVRLVSQVKR